MKLSGHLYYTIMLMIQEKHLDSDTQLVSWGYPGNVVYHEIGDLDFRREFDSYHREKMLKNLPTCYLMVILIRNLSQPL